MTILAYHSTVLPNRPHDYAYDQTFTVSSIRDHVKELSRTQAQNIVINPNFVNMFSALKHYPSSSVGVKPNHLPVGIGNDRSTAIESEDISGSCRYKYSTRPMIPSNPVYAGQVIYAKQPGETTDAMAAMNPSNKPKQTKTVGCQSTFRISETQTDPYSPDYIYDSSLPVPELVSLSSLVYGKGLPAGEDEVEMIERARWKREWELTLPSVTDKEAFEKRVKMMEDMELKEWKHRDMKIKKVQEERLKALEAVIRQREQQNDIEASKRVEILFQKKMQEKDIFTDRLNLKKVRGMRKLQEARLKIDKKSSKRDIISDYGNYSSRVYAPKARDGLSKISTNSTVQIDLEELENYKGLEHLQSQLDTSITESSAELPTRELTRKQLALKIELDNMSAKVTETKERQTKPPPLSWTAKYAIKVEKAPERPITPSVTIPTERQQDMEVAAIKLQNIIRGRAVQEKMFKERTDKQHRIDELREKVRLQSMPKVESSHGTTSILQENKTESGVRFETTIGAEYVGKTLDFLTKELVRLREERRLAALIKLAHRERRMREAEESGKRQLELIKRQEEDLVFKQVLSVHQESVDSYLEDVISYSVDNRATEEAHTQARDLYKHRMEKETKEPPSDEQMLEELVSSFLLPYMDKAASTAVVERNQTAMILAAKQSLSQAVLALKDKPSDNTETDNSKLPPLP